MSKIIKYKLKSKASNDETFEVTKITKTTTKTELTTETDENGNLISARRKPESKVYPPVVEEGIRAIALPSGTKAEVIILETDEGLTEEGKKEEERENNDRPIVMWGG